MILNDDPDDPLVLVPLSWVRPHRVRQWAGPPPTTGPILTEIVEEFVNHHRPFARRPWYRQTRPKRVGAGRPHGAQHTQAKLTEDQVRTILADTTQPHRHYAVLYGVSLSTVSRIRRGQDWAHLAR